MVSHPVQEQKAVHSPKGRAGNKIIGKSLKAVSLTGQGGRFYIERNRLSLNGDIWYL